MHCEDKQKPNSSLHYNDIKHNDNNNNDCYYQKLWSSLSPLSSIIIITNSNFYKFNINYARASGSELYTLFFLEKVMFLLPLFAVIIDFK